MSQGNLAVRSSIDYRWTSSRILRPLGVFMVIVFYFAKVEQYRKHKYVSIGRRCTSACTTMEPICASVDTTNNLTSRATSRHGIIVKTVLYIGGVEAGS